MFAHVSFAARLFASREQMENENKFGRRRRREYIFTARLVSSLRLRGRAAEFLEEISRWRAWLCRISSQDAFYVPPAPILSNSRQSGTGTSSCLFSSHLSRFLGGKNWETQGW
jgi:hypothetical protein